MAAGQLVNAFGLNKGRIHIKADQPAHAAVHIVLLEREVHARIGRQRHQFLLESGLIFQRSADRKLHTRAHIALRVLDAHSACQSFDGIDIQLMAGNYLRRSLYLLGTQASADGGKDVAVLALTACPTLIIVV